MNLSFTGLSTILANVQLSNHVGVTFSMGFLAMMTATIFFIFQAVQAERKWRDSMLVVSLITFVAAVNFLFMRSFWAETGSSPLGIRYSDWMLTVPLMCVEFFLILREVGAKYSLLWRLVTYSLWMLLVGYLGATVFKESSAVWGAIATFGYLGIIYEVLFGSVKELAQKANDAELQKTIRTLGRFIIFGWAIYPIGYMAIPGGLLDGVLPLKYVDLLYNIGDMINKIGFGLVIYSLVDSKSRLEKTTG